MNTGKYDLANNEHKTTQFQSFLIMNMKPHNFNHFNVIVIIKKTNNGEKKYENPLRYNEKKKIEIKQFI